MTSAPSRQGTVQGDLLVCSLPNVDVLETLSFIL